MFLFFLWILWIWILITVFTDIFRSHDLSCFAKALNPRQAPVSGVVTRSWVARY
jgi:hypothetical protein